MNPNPPELNPTVVALGGIDLPVTYKPGQTGPAVVKVRILEIDQFGAYIDAALKELKCAELVCAQPPGWAASLDLDSVLAINEKAFELNFPPAQRWLNRRAAIIERLGPASEIQQRHLAARSRSASSAPGSA